MFIAAIFYFREAATEAERRPNTPQLAAGYLAENKCVFIVLYDTSGFCGNG